jgi:hypothetical protein
MMSMLPVAKALTSSSPTARVATRAFGFFV